MRERGKRIKMNEEELKEKIKELTEMLDEEEGGVWASENETYMEEQRKKLDSANIQLKTLQERNAEVKQMINKIKNPYPLDVFPGLENEDVASVIDLIKEKSNISPDRFSAHLMRKARENLKKEFLKDLELNDANDNKLAGAKNG